MVKKNPVWSPSADDLLIFASELRSLFSETQVKVIQPVSVSQHQPLKVSQVSDSRSGYGGGGGGGGGMCKCV